MGDLDDEEGPDPMEEWKGMGEKELCAVEDRITPEAFEAWRMKFEEEMVQCGVLRRGEIKGKTGKQIFLETRSEPGKGDAEQNNAATAGAGADGKAPLVYDAALFGEDDLDD